MSTPVDPDALAEALETLAQHGVYTGVKDSYRTVVEACESFLEAPTAEWCSVHDAQKERDLPDGKWCDWAEPGDPCKFGRVRLVAEEET